MVVKLDYLRQKLKRELIYNMVAGYWRISNSPLNIILQSHTANH